jgi:hypothetical protein
VRGKRRDAERKMTRRIAEIQAGVIATGSRLLVREFLDQWVRQPSGLERGASTVERYRQIVEWFLKPTLCHRFITKLTQTAIEDALQRGVKPNTPRGKTDV